MNSYTVNTTEYGRYIQGSIPASDLEALLKKWGKNGYMDFLIAWSYPQCIGAYPYTKKSGEKWRKHLAILGILYRGQIEGKDWENPYYIKQ